MPHTFESLHRIDRAWAKLEGWLVIALFCALLFIGSVESIIQLLTRLQIHWIDELYLGQGGRWVWWLVRLPACIALLAGSLAAHHDKHWAIDVVGRTATGRTRHGILAVRGLVTGVIVLLLAFSFFAGVRLALEERPVEYEYETGGPIRHICDASDAELASLEGVQRPVMICAVRSTLRAAGLPFGTPENAIYLIAPWAMLTTALRFLLRGAESFRRFVLYGSTT